MGIKSFFRCKDEGIIYGNIPLETFRCCTKNFLTNELKLIPSGWTLIAVGRESHKALSYLYPGRSILGVPHPTGSHGHFNNLFKKKNRQKFQNNVQKQVNTFKNQKGQTIWLEK